jgi:hypothetical protein
MNRRLRHAFVVRDGEPIPPLDAVGGDAWLLDTTVRERRARALRQAGLHVEEVATIADAEGAAKHAGGALIVRDSVAVSAPVITRLLDAFLRDTRPALLAALPDAISTRNLSHVDGLDPVELDGARAFTAPLAALAPGATLAEAQPVLLPFKEQVAQLPMPIGMLGVESTPFGATDAWMCRVDHWCHILRINMQALVSHWIDRWNRGSGRAWFLWRALLGFPWRRGRLTASINKVHRRAKIHHRAHVELSVIEDGVEIGANAVVKNSYVGRGAKIDDGAHVNACVLAPGAMVSTNACVLGSVLYPKAFAAQEKMQMSILGEGSVAFTGSFFYDLNFERPVRVSHRGRVVDAGDRFLSVCVGPWARVAGGVWVASGREIPGGALIVQDQANVLRRTDDPALGRHLVEVTGEGIRALGPVPSNRPTKNGEGPDRS